MQPPRPSMGEPERVAGDLPIPIKTCRNSPIIKDLLSNHTVFFARALYDRVYLRRKNRSSNKDTNGTRDNAP
jgi:hypothetical protein